MPGSILVTGAAGFIGSHTCDQLLAAGYPVIGIDNFRSGKRENLQPALSQPNFTFLEADVSTPSTLAQIAQAQRPSALIHLAALVSVQESIDKPDLNFLLNLQATHCAAEAARLAHIPRLVFASSAAIYGDPTPLSPYGAAKFASESLLLGHGATYGFTVRCQRYFNVYGPRQDPSSPYSGVISIFAQRAARSAPITINGDGEQTRDFISVHDVARANLLAATQPNLASGSADICTGQSTTIKTLATLIANAAPNPAPIQHAPARAGDIRFSLGQPDAARAALSFSANVALAEGLRELRGHR